MWKLLAIMIVIIGVEGNFKGLKAENRKDKVSAVYQAIDYAGCIMRAEKMGEERPFEQLRCELKFNPNDMMNKSPYANLLRKVFITELDTYNRVCATTVYYENGDYVEKTDLEKLERCIANSKKNAVEKYLKDEK